MDAPFEFQISDVFSVPFSGTVVSGVITSGVVHGTSRFQSFLLGVDPMMGIVNAKRRASAVHESLIGIVHEGNIDSWLFPAGAKMHKS